MAYSFAPLVVIGASALLAILIEVLSWLIVFRTSHYRRLKAELEIASKKHAEYTASSSGKNKDDKKRKKLDDAVQAATRDMFQSKWKIGLINAVILFIAYRLITTKYAGVPIAKLPFMPPGFVRKASHSGLEGEDWTECSALFIYILCQVGLRPNIVKLLDLGPSRALTRLTSMQSFADKVADKVKLN